MRISGGILEKSPDFAETKISFQSSRVVSLEGLASKRKLGALDSGVLLPTIVLVRGRPRRFGVVGSEDAAYASKPSGLFKK